MDEEYTCSFCQRTVEAEDYPEHCPHCNVSRCQCGTFIPGEAPKFCYGCGAIPPKLRGTFCRSSSTAVMYAQEEWCCRNLGRESKGPFVISTGVDGSWLSTNKNGTHRDVRELTAEEKKILGYKKA